MQNQENNQWLKQFHSILEEHLSEMGFSNKKIAKYMEMSERQFYRKVKAITQQTPNQYIRYYRLQYAKIYLEQGTYKTVREVCFAVGYTNVNYFRKQFEQVFNKSPIEILRELGWR